jgi:hypothetical protein
VTISTPDNTPAERNTVSNRSPAAKLEAAVTDPGPIKRTHLELGRRENLELWNSNLSRTKIRYLKHSLFSRRNWRGGGQPDGSSSKNPTYQIVSWSIAMGRALSG